MKIYKHNKVRNLKKLLFCYIYTAKQCNELTSGAIQGKVPTRDIFVVLANSRDVPKSQIYTYIINISAFLVLIILKAKISKFNYDVQLLK